MKRRITAWMLALALIVSLSALPIGAYAAGTDDIVTLHPRKDVYQYLNVVFLRGAEAKPHGYLPIDDPDGLGLQWFKYTGGGRSQVSYERECEIPIHEEHTEGVCYSTGLTCTLAQGPDHTHSSEDGCYGTTYHCPYATGEYSKCFEKYSEEKKGIHTATQCASMAKKYFDYYAWYVDMPVKDRPADRTEQPDVPADPESSEPENPTVTIQDNPCTLHIQCVNSDQEPLVGVEFFLCEYDPEAESVDEIVSGFTKETEGRGIVASLDFTEYVKTHNIKEDVVWELWMILNDDLAAQYKEMQESYYLLVGPDENNKIVLKGVSATPPKPIEVQPTEPEDSDGEQEGTEASGGTTDTTTSNNRYTFTNAGNYTPTTRTLSVRCESYKGTVRIDVITTGLEKAPADFSVELILTDPDGEEHLMELNKPGYLTEAAGYINRSAANSRLFQFVLEDVDMGTYTLTASPTPDLNGYTESEVAIEMRSPAENSVEPEHTNEVTLTCNNLSVLFTVIYEYVSDTPDVPEDPSENPEDPSENPEDPSGNPEDPSENPEDPSENPEDPSENPEDPSGNPEDPSENPEDPSENPEDPSEPNGTEPTVPTPTVPDATNPPATKPSTDSDGVESASNTVIVKVVDDLGNPLKNCELGLYKDKKVVKKWTATYDNTYVLDDLEDLAESSGEETYILRQTKAAPGYRLSGDSFKVTISGNRNDPRVEIKKNSSGLSSLLGGTGMEIGSDGKQIATFVNERKTAQMELALEVFMDFAEEAWKDEALMKGFVEREYEFILTWENLSGETEEKTIVLTSGTSQLLDVELPFGTDYSLRPAETDGYFQTEFSENFEGTIGTEHLTEVIHVDAVHTYTVESGEAPAVSLVKVDATNKMPMAGVHFTLNDSENREMKSYVSDEQGQLELVNVFKAPGTYKLVETQTLEGYELLKSPVVVDVTVQYSEEMRNGSPVLLQTMNAELSGNMIVEESDGSFWVENMPTDALEENESRKPGRGIFLVIGGIALAGAAVCTVVLIKKRPKKANDA